MTDRLTSWFLRQKQRIPLFVQSILSYLLVVCIMIVTLFMVVGKARETTVSSYLNERSYALQSSVSAFERQMENFRSVACSVQSTDHYHTLRFQRPNTLSAQRHYYTYFRLSEIFGMRCSELLNAKNCFLHLGNSASIIWRDKHFSFREEDYLGRIITASGKKLAFHSTNVYSTQSLQPVLFTEDNGEQHEYLLYLYNQQADSGTYGMLLSRADIDALFHINELPSGTRLTIEDCESGTVIYQTGAALQDCRYHTLGCRLPSVPFTALITIPSVYFTQLTKPVTMLLMTYVIVTVLICLVISLWLSRRNSVTVRRLLQAFSNAVKPDGKYKNEFMLLDHNIRLTSEQNQQLQLQIASSRKQMQVSVLSRLMVQETISPVDEEMAREHLPVFADGARLMCMELTRTDNVPLDDVASYQCRLTLESVLSSDCVLVQMRPNLYAALLNDRDVLTKAPFWVAEVNQTLSPIGLRLSVGASEHLESMRSLHDAYTHALYTLRYNATPPLSVFEPAEDPSQLQFAAISNFRNAVITCDEKTALDLLEHFMQVSYQYQWLMPAVRFTLDSVCTETKLDISAVTCDTPRIYTSNVIRALLEKQKNASCSALGEHVLAYLHKSFADSSLSSDALAERFNVSRSYLYRIFRESHGMTPSEMLEKIRMEHAQKLLDETRMNVADIAAACGYNSSNTFYKAYKKRYGCAPNASRGANAARDALGGPEA